MKIKYRKTVLDRMKEAIKEASISGRKIEEIELTEDEDKELQRLCIDPNMLIKVENIQFLGIKIKKVKDNS